MSPSEEIIVKLTAQNGGLNAGMDEATAKVKASTDAMSASVAQAMNTFRDFDNIQKGSIKTAQDVTAAQATLAAAQASGAYTSEELAEKQAILTAAMAKLPKEMEEASAATAAFTMNSRTAYSASALITDALTGQFGRSRREIAALANETGLMSSAFGLLASPAGVAALAVAGVGAAAFMAQEQFSKFEEVVAATNGYWGESAGQLEAAAEKIGDLTRMSSAANTAVMQLAASGRFAGDALAQAGLAAVQFSDSTGIKIEEVDNLLVKMAKDPKAALDDLEDKYHIISPLQREYIEGLIESGDKAGASRAEMDAFATAAQHDFDTAAEHANSAGAVFGEFFHKLHNGFVLLGQDINLALGGGDDAEKLAQLQRRVAAAQQHGSAFEKAQIPDLEKQIDLLQKKLGLAQEYATNQRRVEGMEAASAPKLGSFDALKTQGINGVDLAGNLEQQLHTLEAAQQVSYENREQFEATYWSNVLQRVQTGTAQYIQAWSHVQQEDKQRTEALERNLDAEERKRSELTRRATQEAKQAARERERANEEVAAHDRQMMEQEAQQLRQVANETARDTERSAIDATEVKKEQYQELYRTGQISLQQLVQAELRAVQDRLDAEIRYYTTLKTLDAGDVKATLTDQQAITDAVAKAAQERARIATQAANEELKQRQRIARQEAQLVAQSVNQILFSHQSLKQSLANIGEQMLSRFIENEIEKIAMTHASQGAQSAAVIAGNQMRVAADTAGQAESLAVQGESAIKWIITEAAKAAAGAFNAMVSIPYVGPFLAVGASIAAFAAVSKLVSSVASAEGGWERVPADGMVTELHRDEMVLPKHVADPVRNMAKNGSGGGEVHNHFHAADARSFIDMARRRPQELARLAQQLSRRGYRV